MIKCDIYQHDCEEFLRNYDGTSFDLTFLDPPFNQKKKYNSYNDDIAKLWQKYEYTRGLEKIWGESSVSGWVENSLFDYRTGAE